MSIERLRALIEPFLDSKGYQGKMRLNIRSYLKKLLDFMQEGSYEDLNDSVISEYIKSYEGTSQLGVRKLRVEEFAEYAKGERQISMFEEKAENEELQSDTNMAIENETMNGSGQRETERPEPAVHELLKKRGRKPKAENDNRTQISSYLSNEVYAGIKALSVVTQQPISDIVAQVVKAFYEDNTEVINESIRTMQQLESVKSKIKYHK